MVERHLLVARWPPPLVKNGITFERSCTFDSTLPFITDGVKLNGFTLGSLFFKFFQPNLEVCNKTVMDLIEI